MHKRHQGEITHEAHKFLELVPRDHRKRAELFVDKFSKGGQAHIARLLGYAAEENVLEKAFRTLMRFWKFHWSYQEDDVRGDPKKNPINHLYLSRLYKEIQIIPPWERGE